MYTLTSGSALQGAVVWREAAGAKPRRALLGSHLVLQPKTSVAYNRDLVWISAVLEHRNWSEFSGGVKRFPLKTFWANYSTVAMQCICLISPYASCRKGEVNAVIDDCKCSMSISANGDCHLGLYQQKCLNPRIAGMSGLDRLLYSLEKIAFSS